MKALKLISKQLEVDNIYSFTFEAGPWQWKAGQCLGFVLPKLGEEPSVNERWFTISSAPSQHFIQVTTRITDSSFKQALASLESGDEILTHGLGGKFVWEQPDDLVVFVAGGIGITPFYSMLTERDIQGKPLRAELFYFNRSQNYAFKDKLDELSKKHPEFKLKILIDEPISAHKIFELAPDLQSKTVYLSGPEPMVEAVGAELKNRGVSLKQDWFPGYDEASY